MRFMKNMNMIRKHSNPVQLAKNVKLLRDQIIKTVNDYEDREELKLEIEKMFKDVTLVMMNKQFKEIQKDL